MVALDSRDDTRHTHQMSEQIDINAETARKLHRVVALTGRSVQELLNDTLDAQLEALQLAALRSAVAEGIADADAGRFSDRAIADIFAEGIARAVRSKQGKA